MAVFSSMLILQITVIQPNKTGNMIILIQCRDQMGLVAAISGVLAAEQMNIVSLREHVDKPANLFFHACGGRAGWGSGAAGTKTAEGIATQMQW